MIPAAYAEFAGACHAASIGGAMAFTEARRGRLAWLLEATEKCFEPHTTEKPKRHQQLLIIMARILTSAGRPGPDEFAALSAIVLIERRWRMDEQQFERRLKGRRGNWPPVELDL